MKHSKKTTASSGFNGADDTPVLTYAGFRRLQEEQEADRLLLKELPRRMEKRQQKLDAVLLLAPHLAGTAPQPKRAPDVKPRPVIKPQQSLPLANAPAPTRRAPPVFKGKATWTSAIEKVLTSEDRGLTHRELKDGLEKAGLGPRLLISDKGFYGGIAKLAADERLVKFGGLLYAAHVAEKLQKKGALPDMTAEARQRGGSSTSLAIDVLKQFPGGLTGPQLKELVAAKPTAPKSIRHHGQYIYNILATLMGAGQVYKDGSLYKLGAGRGEANGVSSTVGLGVHHAS